ncbi:hypothetical protein GUJ93_ZPchr0001g30707 [Zizania palustris]|uniref:Uncharacterized protein n=1 Tax=Zizania palustris TaxID=103762 RepID=A0A8J5SAY0_ZIZPA|nr:hypothetical protein GUJ93_ZPchr0001g30707 [Zizania palustris]
MWWLMATPSPGERWRPQALASDSDPKPQQAEATPSPVDAMSRRSEEIYAGETTLRRLPVVGGATSASSAAVQHQSVARRRRGSGRRHGGEM